MLRSGYMDKIAKDKKTGEIVYFSQWNNETIAFGKRLTEQELINRGYSKFECIKSTHFMSPKDFYEQYKEITTKEL